MNNDGKDHNDFVEEDAKPTCQSEEILKQDDSEPEGKTDKRDKWKVERLVEGWKKLPKDIKKSYLLLIFLFALYTVASFLGAPPRFGMLLGMLSLIVSVLLTVVDLGMFQDKPYRKFLLFMGIAVIVALIFNELYWKIPQEAMCEIFRAERLETIFTALSLLFLVVDNIVENTINLE